MLVLPPIARKVGRTGDFPTKPPNMSIKFDVKPTPVIPEFIRNKHMYATPQTEFTDIPQIHNGRRLECLCNLDHNGRKDGEYTQWYLDEKLNQVRRKIHYRDGKRHGKYIRFQTNGQKEEERTYHYGLEHGESIMYDYEGRIRNTCQYYAGKKHGSQKLFDIEGNVVVTDQFEHGLQIGEYRIYQQ